LKSNGLRPSSFLNNTVRDNNRPGSASGNGIYTDVKASNVTIVGNRFENNKNSAIVMVGAAPNTATLYSNITIIGNTSTGDGSMLTLSNAVDSRITGNIIRNSIGVVDDLYLAGNNQNVSLVGNVMINSGDSGIGLVTNAFGDAPAPNSDINIASNVILNAGESGIRLQNDTHDVTVRSNLIQGSQGVAPAVGNGISLEGTASDNTIRSNILLLNNHNGIFAAIGTSDNALRSNVAVLNGTWDLIDNSNGGSGTDGTDNFWSGNIGIKNKPFSLLG
jgi:hypothetical protein